MSNDVSLKCEDCKTPLFPGAEKCGCGWVKNAAPKAGKKTTQCKCGQPGQFLHGGVWRCAEHHQRRRDWEVQQEQKNGAAVLKELEQIREQQQKRNKELAAR